MCIRDRSLGYPNRVLFKMVLTESFDLDNSDDIMCEHLLSLYNNNEKFKLFNDVFSFVLASIPFQQLNIMPNLIEDSLPSILQSLTAGVALIKFFEIDEENSIFKGHNLPYKWIISEENVGLNLRRISEALANIANQNTNLKEFKGIFSIISGTAVQLIRLMVEKSLELAKIEDNPKANKRKVIKDIAGVPSLLPNETTALTIIMNPTTDAFMSTEMKSFYSLCKIIYAELYSMDY